MGLRGTLDDHPQREGNGEHGESPKRPQAAPEIRNQPSVERLGRAANCREELPRRRLNGDLGGVELSGCLEVNSCPEPRDDQADRGGKDQIVDVPEQTPTRETTENHQRKLHAAVDPFDVPAGTRQRGRRLLEVALRRSFGDMDHRAILPITALPSGRAIGLRDVRFVRQVPDAGHRAVQRNGAKAFGAGDAAIEDGNGL